MIPVLIIRHLKERLSKCSLEPLRHDEGMLFRRGTTSFHLDATGFIQLALGAPPLSSEDASMSLEEARSVRNRLLAVGFSPKWLLQAKQLKRPLLLLDATWRLLPELEAKIHGQPVCRSLPSGITTAYPRMSKIAQDPFCGLASVEALYLAKRLLGDDDPALLDQYYWGETFLEHVERVGV